MKTKKKTTPTDQRPVCTKCGGRNVETNAWIEYRPDGTAEVVNTEGPIEDSTGNWCHDCDGHWPIEFPETTPADDARRQEAAAARANGPELLEVCRGLLQGFSDLLDGYDPEELHATPADLIRQAERIIHLATHGTAAPDA